MNAIPRPTYEADDTGLIGLAEIWAARARIAPWVEITPIVPMKISGLRLKAESLHPIGAFKLRGAFNALLCLPEAVRARGVIAHSSGNHAQAVAWAARALGVQAVLVMPRDAPAVKLDGVRRCGGEVVLVGTSSQERSDTADRLARERGLFLVQPYDADEILAATGTIGLEILEQAPDVETVFAPLSGGGLMGGLAAAIKQTRPRVRIVGVEPEVAADAYESFKAGHVVTLPAEQMARTLADGLRAQHLGARTWPHVRAFVDEIITVSEADMAAAMRAIAAEARLVAEPSGAVATAGALAHGADPAHGVAVLSGGNVDLALYARLLAGD